MYVNLCTFYTIDECNRRYMSISGLVCSVDNERDAALIVTNIVKLSLAILKKLKKLKNSNDWVYIEYHLCK